MIGKYYFLKKFLDSHAQLWVYGIDIHGRSQALYTAQCNGIVIHGAKIGGLQVFADHARRNKHKTNASTIFALRLQ